jgi:hypothetical protein
VNIELPTTNIHSATIGLNIQPNATATGVVGIQFQSTGTATTFSTLINCDGVGAAAGAGVFLTLGSGNPMYESTLFGAYAGYVSIKVDSSTCCFPVFNHTGVGTPGAPFALTSQGNTFSGTNIFGPITATTAVFSAAVTANALLTCNAGLSIYAGGATVGGGMSVGGAALLTGTLVVYGATTLDTTLNVAGAVSLSSTLGVTGAAVFNSTLVVGSAVTLNSTLAVQSWIATAANLIFTTSVTSLITVNSGVYATSVLNLTAANGIGRLISMTSGNSMLVTRGLGSYSGTSIIIVVDGITQYIPIFVP